jgi:hypothetical protein
MKKILFLFLFLSSLFAQGDIYSKNPKVFFRLGDEIYNNAEKIGNLKTLKSYGSFTYKIDNYLSEVRDAKKLGYAVESGQKKELSSKYLKTLRRLYSENRYFFDSVNNSFIKSIKYNDNILFCDMVNSNMLNLNKNKSKILSYYHKHSKNIKLSGDLKKIVEKEILLKKRAKNYKQNSKEQRIKRIRANAKYNEEQLQKKLDKELEEKKLQIQMEQQQELFN